MLFRFGWSSKACCNSFSCARSKLQRPIRLRAMPFRRHSFVSVEKFNRAGGSAGAGPRNVPVKSIASLPAVPRLPSGGVETKKASTAGTSVTTSELDSLNKSEPRHSYRRVTRDETA